MFDIDWTVVAYHVKLFTWIFILVALDQGFVKLGKQNSAAAKIVSSLSILILFTVLLLLLEILKHKFPEAHVWFRNFCEPGNACMAKWIPLMFFVDIVPLPSDLVGVPPAQIVLWILAIFLGWVLNLVTVAYISSRLFKCTLPEEDEEDLLKTFTGSTQKLSSVSTRRKDVRRTFNEGSLTSSRPSRRKSGVSEFMSEIRRTERLTDLHDELVTCSSVPTAGPSIYSIGDGALISYGEYRAWQFGPGSRTKQKDRRMIQIMDLVKAELSAGYYSKLLLNLVAFLEDNYSDCNPAQELCSLARREMQQVVNTSVERRVTEVSNSASETAAFNRSFADIESALENIGAAAERETAVVERTGRVILSLRIYSDNDLFKFFLRLSLFGAALSLIANSSTAYYWGAFFFKLFLAPALHMIATTYREETIGWLPKTILAILQPAIVSTGLLMLLAGFMTPTFSFMDGLKYFTGFIDGKHNVVIGC